MKKICPNCQLTNFPQEKNCKRCDVNLLTVALVDSAQKNPVKKSRILRRVIICIAVLIFTLFGFYLSLIGSCRRLSYEEKQTVFKAISVLDEKGFSKEVFLLHYLTAFRANDNWLNASIPKENAYAATNYPFEIMTIYPDYFSYTENDTERAAILLHEAQHLKGADEKQAYKYVWENRKQLGWTKEIYENSVIWRNVRLQTKELAPELFTCEEKAYSDCTEN
ncbi:MAG: hypothetical protein ABIP06_01920 [Pyrinomonadaceae bacterium]